MFSYFEYIFLFLPPVFAIYFLLNYRGFTRAGKIFLVAASFTFYGLWKPLYLPILLASILVNYALGRTIIRPLGPFAGVPKKAVLIAGLIFNIGLLGYFKYTDFMIQNINFISGLSIPLQEVMFPLGISFYTFVQIAFLVDCYRGNIGRTDFIDYSLFVSFFPKLIQGPIAYHEEMEAQLSSRENARIIPENIARGIMIFSIGLFKKMVIADNIAPWVNQGFANSAALNFVEAWIVGYGYLLELYFDFSGYMDMATGAALLFNIRLPQNFNSPFKSTNIQEYWRRWHMTFMRFMRDYVYIPLGGNRKGKLRLYFNIFITFLVGGIWHGASWTFVAWGASHGLALVIHRIWSLSGRRMNKILAWFLTFHFAVFTHVIFRAGTFGEALNVFRGMIGLNGVVLPEKLKGVAFLKLPGLTFGPWLAGIGEKQTYIFYIMLAAAALAFFARNSQELTDRMKPNLRWAFFASLLLGAGIIHITQVSEFIYFNF